MALSRCLHLLLIFLLLSSGVSATTFTFQNNCNNNIWPGIQPGAGKEILSNGGFRLRPGAQVSINAPTGWSGRFWGRFGCQFDQTGRGSCLSGDCGGLLACSSAGDCGGLLACSGPGGLPPVSLAEFTLDSPLDYYDISLVDGFNVPISILPSGGTGNCRSLKCTSNLNENCPSSLQVKHKKRVIACKSACLAFNSPQYCCTGVYANPSTCRPTNYSQIFKEACPDAYSYAYDGASSIATCNGANYVIRFC